MPLEIQAIIDAWISGGVEDAIALTNRYSKKAGIRFCKGSKKDGELCNKPLAPQARGDYCKVHRSQDPARKAQVKKARNKKPQI